MLGGIQPSSVIGDGDEREYVAALGGSKLFNIGKVNRNKTVEVVIGGLLMKLDLRW